MSFLTLVRHGQADFFAEDYDQLTALGEQQAQLLGEYWVRQGQHFDEVYIEFSRVRLKRFGRNHRSRFSRRRPGLA